MQLPKWVLHLPSGAAAQGITVPQLPLCREGQLPGLYRLLEGLGFCSPRGYGQNMLYQSLISEALAIFLTVPCLYFHSLKNTETGKAF